MRVRALEWGVKQSFRNYVAGSGGLTEVDGGAEQTPEGTFVFPAADEGLDVADGKVSGAGGFAGEVRFDAHGGMLKVRLNDLRVEIGPDGGALTVDDRGVRVAVAKLNLQAAELADDGALVAPTTLTIDGIQLLGDHYPMHTPLDPVRLRTA